MVAHYSDTCNCRSCAAVRARVTKRSCKATSTGRFPGTWDQCEGCGRIVYTRADGTARPHTVPTRLPGGYDE